MSDYDFLAQSFALESKTQIKLAVKYQMIRGPVSVLDKFKTLKAAGFKGVEISMAQYKEAKEIKRSAEATGILIHGVVHGSSDNYEEPINLCKLVGGESVLVVARINQVFPMMRTLSWRRVLFEERFPKLKSLESVCWLRMYEVPF